MKLSVIIPVFNANTTIQRLLDSIISQENHSFELEILIINDGSTDDSKDILDTLAASSAAIQVFHIDNVGVYKARNLALTKVTGDYIWMLDSDDHITPIALSRIEECLCHYNTPIEILHLGYKVEDVKGNITDKFPPYVPQIVDGIEFLDRNDGRLYLWNNIYNTPFLKKHQLTFLAKSVSLEDALFNISAFAVAKQVAYCNALLYVYTYQENSISKKKTLQHLLKKGESSQNVHRGIKKVMTGFDIDSKAYNVLNKRLGLSVLGFFFSLLIERYPFSYTKEMYGVYQKEQLLPVPTYSVRGSLKAQVFKKLVNTKFLYFLIVRLYIFGKGTVS
jgi:glycosyltransferase involved in cell wall biosynthesis